MKGLSVICFNIRRFSKNVDEFLGFLSNCEPYFDIITLTEAWTKYDNQITCHIPGYQSAHNNRSDHKSCGASIFV